ncbi:MAG: hypothetical protein QOG97_3200 [Acidimicrobiaceae bacterium]|nr:hypothetical protein [Acidimicrobiaceae bacterium]
MTAVDVTEKPPSPPAGEDGAGEEFPFGLDERGPDEPRRRWHLPEAINWPETIITFVVVAFLCGFVFKFLQPSKLFLDSTASGGDMGAHVWQPAFLRDHLLPHFRLTGWAPDWYAGFPSLVFYFPLPSLLIVIASIVMPYNVAFKLITVLGLVTLPLSAYLFGRLARFRFPGPICLAAATLPFLFARNYTIYGGNIASTLAGEFGFSISLSASLIFLGLVARGLETGKYRALAAIVLVVTGLSHLLPAIFAIIGAIVLTIMRWDRRSWRWITPVFAVAAGLAAFWWLPFLLRLPYATDMGYEKVRQYYQNLFPDHLLWLYVLALVGFAVSILRRQKFGIFISIMAVLSVLIFRFAPQARLWNARVLPFWFLCLYLLAGVAVAEGGAALIEPLKGGPAPYWSKLTTLALPVVAAMAVWIWVGFPLHGLPGGSVDSRTGKYTWLGISNSDTSFIPGWANWNYSGYESSTKSRRAEYFGLIDTMKQVGKKTGCGRAMWEYEPGLDQMGTPDALMLLPYWTNSCIGSMEGLYYESSATTPYHFINAAELSLQPSDPVRGLTYPSAPNIPDGVRHMQLLGVRYYMALTPETQSQADADPDLQLVSTSGPWPVSYSGGTQNGVKERTWKIYEVADSQIVAPLINQPVVMKGIAKGGKQWLDASQAWYLDQNRSDVLYAASGPKSWDRVAPMSPDPPRTALQPVQIDHIASSDNSVSFNVDTVGVPVLVKVSYFPNWQASGAKGPYRVAPNLMVVIPTSHHVTVHYGYTPVDWFGYLLGIVGLAALVWLVRAKPVAFASTGRALASPPDFAEVSGLDEAYVRMQRELSAGMVAGVPGHGSDAGTDEIDAWLGFPAGLGDRTGWDRAPGNLGQRPNGSSGGPASDGVVAEPPEGASDGPVVGLDAGGLPGAGAAERGRDALDGPGGMGARTSPTDADAEADDETAWLGGARGGEVGGSAGHTDMHSDESDVDGSGAPGHRRGGRGVTGETGDPAP